LKPVVTILESIHPDGLEKLAEFADVRMGLGASRSEQLNLVTEANAIIIKSLVQVDQGFFKHAKNLLAIGRAGIGVDNIDLEEAYRRKIKILTVPTGSSVTAAEFAIMHILFLCRRMTEVIMAISLGDFRRHLLEGRELRNMVVGLVGLGNVGLRVAERLQPFGCRLFGFDPGDIDINRFEACGGIRLDSFDQMLPKLDLISFHARLNAKNYHMMGKPEFSKVKKGLMLVNVARAGLIDDLALLEALEKGIVSDVALDVLQPEPPFDKPPGTFSYKHPLLDHPKVFVTPHIGASTVDAQSHIACDIVDQLRSVLL